MNPYNTYKNLSIVIYVLYIPLSFFGFMCGMATDGVIDETNKTIIVLTNIFAYIGLFMPIICFACYLVSKRLKGNIFLSTIIKIFPILILILLLMLDNIIMYIR